MNLEKCSSTKEKGIKKQNRAKYEDYYNALKYNEERTLKDTKDL